MNETTTVNEDGLLCRKARTGKTILLIALNGLEEQFFTVGTAQHWLDIQERRGCTTSLEEHVTDLTWPQMYTCSCSTARFADNTGCQKSTKVGYNNFHRVRRWILLPLTAQNR